jgi:hypothetical protein
MTNNSKAYTLLAITIVSLAYNTIASDFVTAGFQAVAKYVILVGGVCTAFGLAYAEAIKNAGTPGSTTTTSTTTIATVPPTATPPVAKFTRALAAALLTPMPRRSRGFSAGVLSRGFSPGVLSRGFSAVEAMMAIVLFCVALGTVRALAGCGPNTASTAVATVPADAQLALCIANVAETDAGKSVSQVLLDELAQCTADIVPIVDVLDANVIGKLASGTITLDVANAKLAEIHTAAKLSLPKVLVLPVKK